MSSAVSRPGSTTAAGSRTFNFVFLGIVLAAFVAALAGAIALNRMNILPATPLTATYCIDEKLAWMADADLPDADLIAVGSSATWRNLDMRVFVDAGLTRHPINAAPCFLRMNQTAFYAGYLLDRMPLVRTVMTVVTPRDFEACDTEPREFVSPSDADLMLFDGITPWWLYVTNFKPRVFARDIQRLNKMRRTGAEPNTVDSGVYGSSRQNYPIDWREDAHMVDSCFASLTELERTVEAHHARLIVATLPLQPEWSRRFDRDGKKEARWTAGVAQALRYPDTVLVRGDRLEYDDSRFSDHVHLLGRWVTPYSEYLAQTAKAQLLAGPAG